MVANITLGNMKIGSRLILLIIVQILVLVVIGATSLVAVNNSANTEERLAGLITEQVGLGRLVTVGRTNLLDIVDDVFTGRSTWEAATQRISTARADFEGEWRKFIGSLATDKAEVVQKAAGPSLQEIRQAFDEAQTLIENRDRGRLSLFVVNDLQELVKPYFESLEALQQQAQNDADNTIRNTQKVNRILFFGSLAALGVGLLLAGVLGVAIYRSISRPVNRIADTVRRVADGETNARTEVRGIDELGHLGEAFDDLLEERVSTLAKIQQEKERIEHDNESLNSSIMALLQAVAQMSQRDLTVTVPVAEDVTGAVADGLNLLSSETAKVLGEVTHIADEVADTSKTVKRQSDTVIEVADAEREEVLQTTNQLDEAARAMADIAKLANASVQAADRTIDTSRTALEAVTNTVEGINLTRDTIRETEKRIKRLGERSQEINVAVNLINSIAERTHILALNASMHAASAGEAGRGFAVVAEEVQRLAESARDATSQIAALVGNIQTETADTLNTMNNAITQVVEGSQLAEQAGEHMKATQEVTSALVQDVKRIATNSVTQADASKQIGDRAHQIQQSTEKTSKELREQQVQTERLLEYSAELVESVGVFKLPGRVQGAESEETIAEPPVLRVANG